MKIKWRKTLVLLCLLPILIILGSRLLEDTNASFYSQDKKNYGGQVGDLMVKLVDESTVSSPIKVGESQDRLVSVKNEGKINQFVRLMVHPVFQDEIGTLHESVQTDMLQHLDTESWQFGEDGYYYYLKPLESGQTSSDLFKQLKGIESGTLSLHLKVEATSTKGNTLIDAWWQSKEPTTDPLKTIYEQLKEGIE